VEESINREQKPLDLQRECVSLQSVIRESFPGRCQDIRMYSPLTLAYVGDAIYDLIIRTMVVERGNRPVNELHRLSIKYVSANAQAQMAQALEGSFTEEEQAVYRRGRNSKPHTTAKNASVQDYLRATGFEAVLGWLYLRDDMKRILELVRNGIEAAGHLP
jgi:ribonuclease-3 family protein